METIFRITLFIAGAINILPSLLTFLPEKIATSYGIEIPNANFELLLRHRAVLFGIVGGLMIFSAVTKKYYSISVIVGLTSMVSFILLYFLMNGINVELEKVMKIDFVGVVILILGFVLYRLKSRF